MYYGSWNVAAELRSFRLPRSQTHRPVDTRTKGGGRWSVKNQRPTRDAMKARSWPARGRSTRGAADRGRVEGGSRPHVEGPTRPLRWDGDTSLTIDPGLIWSTFLGGSSYDNANAVSVDASGVVTVAGETWSTNFPAWPMRGVAYRLVATELEARCCTRAWGAGSKHGIERADLFADEAVGWGLGTCT